MQNPVKIYKGTPAGLDVLNADTLRTAEPLDTNTCPYCSPGYPDYRHILVKILPVKGRKKNDVSQIILLEVQGSDKGEKFLLPHDFWSFIKGAAYPENEEVPKSHVLSPLEVNLFANNLLVLLYDHHLECRCSEFMKSVFVSLSGALGVFILPLFHIFTVTEMTGCLQNFLYAITL